MIARWPALFVFVTATNLGHTDTLLDLEAGIGALADGERMGEFDPRSLAREMTEFVVKYAPCRDRGAWVESRPWERP